MAGLDTSGNVAPSELPGVVALTLPSPPDEVRLVIKPPERPREDAPVDAKACQWPLSFMSRENFKKGEYLFKIGDRAEKLFYIAKGMIWLPELNLHIKPGQVIGEMGIFSPDKERTASAI